MVKNSFFSRGKLVKIVIIFFGISCFYKMLPAAMEPAPRVVQSQEVGIEASRTFTGLNPYEVIVEDEFNKHITNVMILHEHCTIMRFVPIQNITVSIISIRTGKEVDKRKFTADEVARLKTITIDNSGRIATVFLPQHCSVATEDIRSKTMWILKGLAPAGRRETSQISFKNECGREISSPVTINTSHCFIIPLIKVPLQPLSIEVISTGGIIFAQKFTADEVARLEGLTVSGDGTIVTIEFRPQAP